MNFDPNDDVKINELDLVKNIDVASSASTVTCVSLVVMAFVEEFGDDNEKIMQAAMSLASPKTDKVFVFLPIEM